MATFQLTFKTVKAYVLKLFLVVPCDDHASSDRRENISYEGIIFTHAPVQCETHTSADLSL